ncbi:MAG: hypothetical protein ACI35V_07255 [Sphingobacterium composti]
MRKILLFVMIISSFTTALAQQSAEDLPNFRKNDILIDPFWLIGGAYINFSYERLISSGTGVGANLLLGAGENDEFTQVSPFVRSYFGNKYASGFFLEGFVPITVDREGFYNDGNGVTQVTRTTGGIGFGVGFKWLAKKRMVFEISGGVARRVFGERGGLTPITGKGMVGVGIKL